jgi:SAM-dependent methyltransferase
MRFDKYDLYRKAVQSPDADVEFFRDVYKKLKRKNPKYLREDFCGTFLLAIEWVKLNSKYVSFGLDIDPEPMEYGRKKYLPPLKEDQKTRIKILERDVLGPSLPSADISVAVNFSYYCFKTRDMLKKYFERSYRSLRSNGIFIVDAFGGSQCFDASVDTHKYKGFTYYWDQKGFDPVTNEAVFYIHFKSGNKKYKRVFKYDWRMWSIPEVRVSKKPMFTGKERLAGVPGTAFSNQ